MSQTNDENEALMVGTNFKVGRKLGAGNFGELRLGKTGQIDLNRRVRPFENGVNLVCCIRKARIW